MQYAGVMSPSSNLQIQWSSMYLTETTLWEKKVSLKSCCVSHRSMAGKERKKTGKKIKINQRNGKNQTGSTATMKRLKWQDSKTGNS